MKKILLIFTICSCMFLSGCGTRTENIHIDNRNIWKDSSTNIQIDKKYTFKDYQKEYTENGCTVTINYEIINGD